MKRKLISSIFFMAFVLLLKNLSLPGNKKTRSANGHYSSAKKNHRELADKKTGLADRPAPDPGFALI
jgi:hypothetical protein